MNVANEILGYYKSLSVPELPPEYQLLTPHQHPETWAVMEEFYYKYYNDENPRIGLFGINPGRLGSGLTGIGFTDPYHLKTHCQIDHELSLEKELSSNFIYQVITAYGGPARFFGRFYITAVSPLGFTKNGKNINYYDKPDLLKATTPWIQRELTRQANLPFMQSICLCIGYGKNLKLLSKWNETNHWFSQINSLPHPRWIMQYRRKELSRFLEEYLNILSALNTS